MSPQLVLWAYQRGVFPMADSRRGRVDWYCPDPRAILPLDAMHVPRSLAKHMRKQPYRLTIDNVFERVVRACAEPRPYAADTWINDEIIDTYSVLHHMGYAHSVEAWQDDDRGAPRLVGGIYGLAIGGAFFGESKFSTATNASKICLVTLVEHVRRCGFVLFDVQLNSPHMSQFGTINIPRDTFLQRLDEALRVEPTWE